MLPKTLTESGRNKLKIFMEVLFKIMSGFCPKNPNSVLFCFFLIRYSLKLKSVWTDVLVCILDPRSPVELALPNEVQK